MNQKQKPAKKTFFFCPQIFPSSFFSVNSIVACHHMFTSYAFIRFIHSNIFIHYHLAIDPVQFNKMQLKTQHNHLLRKPFPFIIYMYDRFVTFFFSLTSFQHIITFHYVVCILFVESMYVCVQQSIDVSNSWI